MLVSGFGGSGDTVRKHLSGFFGTGFAGQLLAVHLISRNVVGISFEERAEVLVCGGGVAAVYAFERKTIAGEGVVGLFGDKLFEHLTPRFLLSRSLFAHGNVPYYTGARESIQT